MKFSMKFLFNSYILSKDGEQNAPFNQIPFASSCFYKIKEHTVEHTESTQTKVAKFPKVKCFICENSKINFFNSKTFELHDEVYGNYYKKKYEG